MQRNLSVYGIQFGIQLHHVHVTKYETPPVTGHRANYSNSELIHYCRSTVRGTVRSTVKVSRSVVRSLLRPIKATLPTQDLPMAHRSLIIFGERQVKWKHIIYVCLRLRMKKLNCATCSNFSIWSKQDVKTTVAHENRTFNPIQRTNVDSSKGHIVSTSLQMSLQFQF